VTFLITLHACLHSVTFGTTTVFVLPCFLPALRLNIAKSLSGWYSTPNWAMNLLRPGKWHEAGKFYCLWSWFTERRLTPFITPWFCETRFKYRCNKLLLLSRFSTTGVCDKHLPLVGICHFVGTVQLYKYWPLVRVPPTACIWDTYQVITSIVGTLLLRSHNSLKKARCLLRQPFCGQYLPNKLVVETVWHIYSLGAFVKRYD
jgi:hypothetical protein